jgi:uncharacterized protein
MQLPSSQRADSVVVHGIPFGNISALVFTEARVAALLDTPLLWPLSLTFAPWRGYASERASAFLRGIKFGRAGILMLIEIKDLELHPIDFEEEYRPGDLDLGLDIHQSAPLHAAGRAQLIEEHHGKNQRIKDIRVSGELSTALELPCARCLEPVIQDVRRKFDLLYRPLGTDAGREELSVTGAEAEVSYYQGEGLLLEDAVREQVLLALPLKVICREDCKGLCPHCGANLNSERCSCSEPVEDARWTALKELRSKLGN